jgi:hypothetical protein
VKFVFHLEMGMCFRLRSKCFCDIEFAAMFACRQSIKHSLDLDRESSTPSSMTSISPLEIMKDSKRFVSEPSGNGNVFSS